MEWLIPQNFTDVFIIAATVGLGLFLYKSIVKNKKVNSSLKQNRFDSDFGK